MFKWYAPAHVHQIGIGHLLVVHHGCQWPKVVFPESSVPTKHLNVVRPQSGFKNYLKEMNSSVRKTELEK
jgi:hypothetical protein